MPNWVYNKMTVTGSKPDLEAFAKKASEQRPEGARPSDLSFWNFVRPADSELVEYHETGWYDWNIKHWGTKWDACDAEAGDIERQADDDFSLDYEFSTAWADPKEVFEAMVSQHPELSFSVTCNEEQGWGIEYWGEKGELTVTDKWNIPETHEERESRFGQCYCEIMDDLDTNYMFDDCPKKKEKVTV
jgi:hypothetical protein